jgi:hypothetical protein
MVTATTTSSSSSSSSSIHNTSIEESLEKEENDLFERNVLREMMLCARDGFNLVMPFIFELIMTILLFLLALMKEFEWNIMTTTTATTITGVPNVSQDQEEKVHLPVISEAQEQLTQVQEQDNNTKTTKVSFDDQDVLQQLELLPDILFMSIDTRSMNISQQQDQHYYQLIDSIKRLQYMRIVWMFGKWMYQYQTQLQMLLLSSQTNWNNQNQLQMFVPACDKPIQVPVNPFSTPITCTLQKKQQNNFSLQDIMSAVTLTKMMIMYQYQLLMVLLLFTHTLEIQQLLLCGVSFGSGDKIDMDLFNEEQSDIISNEATNVDIHDKSEPELEPESELELEEIESTTQVSLMTLDQNVPNERIHDKNDDTNPEDESELRPEANAPSETVAFSSESDSNEATIDPEEESEPELKFETSISLHSMESGEILLNNTPVISTKRTKSDKKTLVYDMKFEDDQVFPFWRKCQIKFENNWQTMVLERKWKRTIVSIEDLRSLEYISRRELSTHKTSTFVRLQYICRNKHRSNWTSDSHSSNMVSESDSGAFTSNECTVSLLLRARDPEAKISLLYLHRWMCYRELKICEIEAQQKQKCCNSENNYYIGIGEPTEPIVDGFFI